MPTTTATRRVVRVDNNFRGSRDRLTCIFNVSRVAKRGAASAAAAGAAQKRSGAAARVSRVLSALLYIVD